MFSTRTEILLNHCNTFCYWTYRFSCYIAQVLKFLYQTTTCKYYTKNQQQFNIFRVLFIIFTKKKGNNNNMLCFFYYYFNYFIYFNPLDSNNWNTTNTILATIQSCYVLKFQKKKFWLRCLCVCCCCWFWLFVIVMHPCMMYVL